MVRLTFLALTFVIASWAFADGKNEQIHLPKVGQIIVLVCDGLTLQSLMQMDEPIPTLLQKGAVGLLSGSSLELSGRKGVFVTLGSGRRAKANEHAELGKWLKQGGKSFQLVGNEILEAMVGVKAYCTAKTLRQPDAIFAAAKKESLIPTLKSLIKRLDKNSCLWLVVPNSPQTGWSTRRLTPILVFGEKVPSGLLTSPTTRKVGLVSSVDFAPTLLAQIGVEKPITATGNEMKIVRFEGDRLIYLKWLDERSVRPLRDLPALAFTMSSITASALALVVLASLSAVRSIKFQPTRFQKIVKSAAIFLVLAGMSIPASLFIVTNLPHETGVTNALQLLLLTCVFSLLALKLSFWIDKVLPEALPVSLRAAGFICAFTSIVALLGVPLYWATPLGFYPTTGWRYFGITNSGIGLALAGTVFAWKLLSLPNRFAAIWLTLSPLLAGFSFWGANFGGALTLAIGFAASWVFLVSEVFSWRKIAGLILVSVFLTVATLSAVESFIPTEQKAHWGQLLERMESLGFAAVVDIVGRKLMLLWEFFARTTLNLFAFLLFVAFHFGTALMSRRSHLFSKLKPAFIATFIGSWAGLFLNDSGMEIVGMAMVIFGGVFLLAMVEDLDPFSKSCQL
ncbi:MAG: hypothetical protein N3B10_14305 [Armatimonadetes bacterium]|nr:hypothetical protein [Armatimonadota bacterium]MCX7969642.1 hypothetical protein [Armatimonadota bacterium]MDW8143800.1 hypothetical protein [Armatimonadota bacterium]